jgi:DNA-binding response OmpR family regulator
MAEPARVLVVDDNARMVALVERWLAHTGYRVTGTTTVQEALQALRTQPFDWVIVDLRLPTGDGLDILAYARAQQPEARVVIMTAFGSEATRQRALAQGAHAFLSKPFSGETLLAILGHQPPPSPSPAPTIGL